MDFNSKENVLANLIDREKPVRFSCSDIAAIAGYHPYSNISDLFEKYLYQDLDLLKQIDCRKLGIEIISVEEGLESILTKIGAGQEERFRQILKSVESEDSLQNQNDAQLLLKDISDLVRSPELIEVISIDELELLQREMEGKVKKQYGIFSEESALNRYEDMTGFKVVERNETVHILEVAPLVVDLTGELSSSRPTQITLDNATENVCIPPHVTSFPSSVSEKKQTMIDVTSILMSSSRKAMNTSGSTTSLKRKSDGTLKAQSSLSLSSSTSVNAMDDSQTKKQKKIRPAFFIIGKVDGISYQLDMSAEDATKWKPTKVVVEVKSRVFSVKDPPPLYEQIQLVAYMVMLNCRYGDLVQAIRKPQSVEETNRQSDQTSVGITEQSQHSNTVSATHIEQQTTSVVVRTDSQPSYKISRISLNAPPYYHQFHWDTVIVPRLHVFRDAILAVRNNDDIRASFLLSEDDVRLALIHHLCPYFSS